MRYTLAGISAIVLWSMTIPLFKSVCQHMDAFCGIGVGFGCGGFLICLFTFRPLLRCLKAQPPQLIWSVGVLFIIYQCLLTVAIASAQNGQQALEIGLMNYLWPSMMIVCNLFFFKQKWNLLLPLGMLLSFLGVAFASMPNFNLSEIGILSNPIPYILGFTAAFLWGLYSVIGRRYGNPQYPLPVGLYLFSCGLSFYLWAAFHGRTQIPSAAYLDIGLLTVCIGIAYLCWDYAVSKGDLVLLATASYFIPLLSILFGTFYLSDVQLNYALLGGSIAVVSGAFLCKISIKKPSPHVPVEQTTDGIITDALH